MPFPDLTEIYNLRVKLKLSQTQLSERLKIPQATLSRIERGIANPSYKTVKKIFDYLERVRSEKKESQRKAKDIMTKSIISIDSKSTIKKAVDLMNENSLSQIPILDDDKNLGSITAKKIQKTIIENPELLNMEINLIKELPFPEVEKDWDIKDISNLLLKYPAVLVKEYGKFVGIITDADLLSII